ENVGLAEDEVLLALERDFGAAVLPVEDLVADLDVHGDAIAVLEASGSDCDDLTLLRLFLGGVGDVEPAPHLLGFLERLDDYTIGQGRYFGARSGLCCHGGDLLSVRAVPVSLALITSEC